MENQNGIGRSLAHEREDRIEKSQELLEGQLEEKLQKVYHGYLQQFPCERLFWGIKRQSPEDHQENQLPNIRTDNRRASWEHHNFQGLGDRILDLISEKQRVEDLPGVCISTLTDFPSDPHNENHQRGHQVVLRTSTASWKRDIQKGQKSRAKG